MVLGTYFKQKRLAKGLNYSELAKLISGDFQPSLFWDFEDGDDNDIDGFTIAEFKRYCEVLDISPVDFADILVSDIKHLPLPLLIKSRREEKGYSVEQLADKIGFEAIVIQAIEENSYDTEVVLNVLREAAMVLDIPFRLILEKI
jgi:transcriptional regulator with XRE-family HTH domain